MRRSALQLAASLLSRAASSGTSSAASSATKLASIAGAQSTAASSIWSSSVARAIQQQSARGVRYMSFPPRQSQHKMWQARFDPGGAQVIWSLIAANGAIYLLWRIDPYLASKHFVVSLDSLRDGRIWTAVTAAFSQSDTMHLAGNCISLYFFGSDIGRIFGGRKLLMLYLAGGIAGSLAHCAQSYYKEQQRGGRGRWGTSLFTSKGALGASAAVNAIMLVDILLFPTRTILLYGFIPLPAALLGLLWLWNDLGGTLSGGPSPVAHAGHLGGAATGLAFFLAFKRGHIRPKGWW